MLFALKNRPSKWLYPSILWIGMVHVSIETFSLESCVSCSLEEESFVTTLQKKQETILAQTFEEGRGRIQNEAAGLFIFVSFSLPSRTLKSLYKEAKRGGGKLVLRGLYQNSFQKTVEKLKELEIEVVIDPLLFRKYQITRVPAFLLLEDEKRSKISGHISFGFALQKLKEAR